MWERTLQDLIRGLRANKKDEAQFIAKAIEEIRQEIKGDDMELKAGAVLKLTYLDMLGYDMSWAAFHVVEVMSSPRIHLKTVGYLAAVQSFDQETDVLMLTTNLLKKDLIATPADIAVTLNGISHIITPDLARDLSPELVRMLSHSRPHVRKRAVIALYKVMMKYPEVSQHAISRLKERLEDNDPGVVATTVNVLCELTRHNPGEFLTLAPPLFHLMTTSTNNWMLIKIIKLFGSLSPYEPRLVKKLQPPITELISTTPAISLLYECVHTCIIGGMLSGSSGDSLAKTCVSKLANFIQDADQNLKYIALLAMVKIVPTHPHLVSQYQDTIMASVNDQDMSIRMRALDLVSSMVNQSNLQSIVQQLLSHLVTDHINAPTAAQALAQNVTSPSGNKTFSSPSQSPTYRLILAQHILDMCSHDTYDNVTNFEWYLSVLIDLAHVANVDIGAQIRDQLVDIVTRVRGARRYAVKLMYTLLSDDAMLRNAHEEGSCSEVLWAAAYICGEYGSELADPQKLLPLVLQPEISNLSPEIIAVYLHAATKIFGFWAADLASRWSDDDLQEVKNLVQLVLTGVGKFVASPHIEVQERAANATQLFTFIQADLNAYRPRPEMPSFADTGSSFEGTTEPHFPKSLFLIEPLISSHELNPVAAQAQSRVPVPEGLDLDSWIIPPPEEPKPTPEEKKIKKNKKGKGKEVLSTKVKNGKKKKRGDSEGIYGNGGSSDVLTPVDAETEEERAERERRRAERLERLKDDPYYIMDKTPSRPSPAPEDVDSIPVVKLDDMPSLSDHVDSRLPSLRPASPQVSSEPYYIDKVGEMPRNAVAPLTQPLPPSRQSTPGPVVATPSPVPLLSNAFQQYEGADADTRASTPDPVVVIRAKKKAKTATGKKKRINDLTASAS
ncbi:Ap3d1 protein [Dendrothele bispora CBS 962.96]|uniref:AP-3 complex subunit delta n=1 Tax=Dendrothele bispora (strain CBS 962.96) TaxID=1314807 RepID=A0A4S8MTS1_DENBC|nr:Ap3d1 protein [Dendrothele bispora CBS 962.96]